MLLPKIRESLAGRVEILNLHTLSELEKEQIEPVFLKAFVSGQLKPSVTGVQQEIADVASRVCQGGFPEPHTRARSRARQWFRQYLQTIIQKDVKDIANIRNEDELQRLAELIALRTGSLLNVNSIAADLKLNRETAEKYISILEHLFVIKRLPAWHNNQSKRLVKAPKMHFFDSGLAAHMNHLTPNDWHSSATEFGNVLESFVVQQIRTQAAWFDEPIRLSHYRDKDQVEVDLVLEIGRDLYGIEVKKAASIQLKDGAGLKRLASQAGTKFKGGLLLYCGNNAMSLSTPNCMAAPIDWLWRNDFLR